MINYASKLLVQNTIMTMRDILSLIYKKSEETLSGHGLEKYYIVRAIAGYLKSQLKSDSVVIDGHKLFLDSEDSLRLSINKVYEPFEIDIAKKEIHKGDTVLELGAYIGYHTLIFAKLVGDNGKVIAFEPEPNNFELLKRNVEVNNYKNIILVQKAVSNKTGKIKIYLSKKNKGDHRIFDSRDNRDFTEIDAIRLDEYFKNNKNKINFIWMSIQGAEFDAIQGMSDILRESKNVKIVSEFTPHLLEKFGRKSEEYLRTLQDYGFKIQHLDRKKKVANPIEISNLLKKYTSKKENATHLLCTKKILEDDKS